ncbi:MAG: polysaccharide deacetylase family protein (PEP-CTERM system associated) [Desulforhopalus sp.]|jgi:polysaccharide deacetylase family protein (PEP-CTERM system associated)
MHTILLTFDIEDWFQVENFKEYIPYSSWSSLEQRVHSNTIALLDLLDDAPTILKATFFILGWIAERNPNLVSEISKRGHEVASHGYNHKLCYHQSSDELYNDLDKSKKLLEDITGQEVSGYRAPSFSITDEALTIVQKAGYKYDSSYNSYDKHGRYGSIALASAEKQNLPLYKISPSFHEIPVSNLSLHGKIIPWGGGGYFRLLPSFLHGVGVSHILKENGCYTFYMHPWEIDPEQPRVKKAKASFRFRHYVNLSSTKKKLITFIVNNPNVSFLSCSDFIES